MQLLQLPNFDLAYVCLADIVDFSYNSNFLICTIKRKA